ncbi:unnamed protein product [Acanthoscelides obtectus]|nr:unnamed protein product [Acanthoscelides obtectus]CAK1657926.1 Probable E3 ubiquitin-protein ligase sinah [Acanthoscelides obtectus]
MPVPLYATIAEHFTFPCSFADCDAELKWGDVKEHESLCFFRDMSCPYIGCVETYKLMYCLSHFKVMHVVHYGIFCSDYISVNVLNYVADLHCIAYKENVFLVFIKLSRDPTNGNIEARFSVTFAAIETDGSRIECEVKIMINPDNTVKKVFKFDDMEEYTDTQHCLGCSGGFCDKPGHRNNGSISFTNVLEFRTENLFSYSIRIYEKKTSGSRIAECPVCYVVFDSPIYQCLTGHSFCSTCYNSLSTCPICRVQISGEPIRNFALEGIMKECDKVYPD